MTLQIAMELLFNGRFEVLFYPYNYPHISISVSTIEGQTGKGIFSIIYARHSRLSFGNYFPNRFKNQFHIKPKGMFGNILQIDFQFVRHDDLDIKRFRVFRLRQ